VRSKATLVRCGIGAIYDALNNEFSQLEHETNLKVAPSGIAFGGREVPHQRKRAMKIFITALVLVFALASGTSMMALTGHDYTHVAQNGAYAAGNQKAALLY
jgi:hypothetical protein